MKNSMNLRIMPVAGSEELVKEYYSDHGSFHDGDAGLDLFCLEDLTVPPRAYSVKMTLGVCAQAFYTHALSDTTGFYLYPRSSTGSKTPIRLSNSVGIIDAGYRGPLTAILDNVSDEPFTMKKGERYFQVCAPDLVPIRFTLVSELSDSSRGKYGFGSTGN
uniref:dUTP diphosphatase n=1 Tax=Marseillevirus LCMAC201 TaxID=2506605 RepID=A0A481YWV4_9VIRU|nr:MAG: dUTP diphosphatase [Marseillevirus LCMAC201]